MAKIPKIIKFDETLMKVDKKLEEKQRLEGPRNYLGMSQIGEECWRKLFYSFRGCKKREIAASGIKAIEDGFKQEDIMAERLRLLSYIELHTMDPNNPKEQIGFKTLLDHFRGHCDGMIKYIKEAPQSWHVWENKSVNEIKFKKMLKFREELGEKNALREWDEIYYAQAQLYMHCATVERHYLTIQTPGGRAYLSVRTNYNAKQAEALIEKAKVIIFDNFSIPAKLSEKREFYKCKWCEFQEICHDGDFPEVNCKTCKFSEPTKNGLRLCHKKNETLDNNKLFLNNCTSHLYNPALISADVIDEQEDCFLYRTASGFIFANCTSSGMPAANENINIESILPSLELFEKIRSVNNFSKEALTIQKTFDGDILGSKEKTQKAWESNNKLKGI